MAKLLRWTFKINYNTSIEQGHSLMCIVQSARRCVHKCSNINWTNRLFNSSTPKQNVWTKTSLCNRQLTNSSTFSHVRPSSSCFSTIHNRRPVISLTNSSSSSSTTNMNISRYNHTDVDYNFNNQSSSSSNIDWSLKEVFICCNENIWEEKQEGFDLQFRYIDTHGALDDDTQHSAKVIVGLFGHPGSHVDIQQLLQPFAEQGYRVIIPIMPGFGETKAVTKKEEIFFTQSSTEKLHLLVQLLSYLNVNKIHSVVAHDSASGMLSMMLATTDVIQSAIYVCPIPCHSPPTAYQPQQYLRFLINWYENGLSYFKPILLALMKAHIKKKKISVSTRYTYEFILSAVNHGYEYISGLMLAIENKPVNISVIYSNRDTYVEKPLTLEYVNIMGVKETSGGDSGGSRTSGSNQGIRRVVELDSDSHFPHCEEKYRHVIVEEIDKLLQFGDR